MADIKIADALIGVMALAVSWIFKTVIQHGKELVGLQTAFKYYLERTGKGAAMVLDSPNPTPPEIRALLRKHVDGALTAEERQELIAYLRRLKDDTNVSKPERTAAIQLLAAMETMKMIKSA